MLMAERKRCLTAFRSVKICWLTYR